MAQSGKLNRSAALPPGLDAVAIGRAVKFIEKELVDLVEIYYEQANVFSAIVGIVSTKALDAVSAYEKHRHAHTAQ